MNRTPRTHKTLVVLAIAASVIAAIGTARASGLSELRSAVSDGRMIEAVQLSDRLLRDQEQDEAPTVHTLRAEALVALGHVFAARDALQTARDVSSEPRLDTECLLAQVLIHAGDRESASEQFTRCLDLARSTGAVRVEALAQNDLGVLRQARGDVAGAAEAYGRGRALADQVADPLLLATVTLNQTRLSLGLDGADRRAAVPSTEAPALLNQTLARFMGLPLSQARLQGLVAVGRAAVGYLESPSPRSNSIQEVRGIAYRSFGAAREDASALTRPGMGARVLGHLGRLYELSGRADEALILTREALRGLRSDADRHRLQWQEARLLRASGEVDAAVQAYQSAIDSLTAVRGDLSSSYFARGRFFRREVGPLFRELADLLLESGDGSPIALREARAVIETLKQAELREYFQDQCLLERGTRSLAVDDLEARTAVVYPIILPDRLEILVTIAGVPTRHTIPVAESDLTRQVRALRQLLEKRTTHQYRKPASALYDLLIRPLEPTLEAAGITTLVILPDGVLRLIPFGALLRDRSTHLVDRYAIAVSPGLELIEPTPFPRDAVTSLTAGLSEGVQGFSSLPHVDMELLEVSRLMPGTVLSGPAFRTERLKRSLGGRAYDVVHIASHGVFEASASDSYLVTYDGRIAMDGLERLVGLTRYRDRPIELLTLSACQTAAGDDRAALGLAGVAFKAGARSVVATLWFINDEASSEVVTRFYDLLRYEGMSKAEALRRAQIAIKQEPRFRHPYYWSAFMVIGNWL